MGLIGRNVKVWILITLCCLLAWLIYWVPSSIDRFFGFHSVPWEDILQREGGLMFMLMEVSGGVGILLRCVGVLSGIIAILVLIRNRAKGLFDVRKLVVLSLLMESCFFLLLLPSGFALLGFGGSGANGAVLTSILLGVDYFLMILVTAPFLAVLAFKLFRSNESKKEFHEWKWIGLSSAGYIIGLWANSVIKWFDMIFAEGFSFFALGIRALGAINSLVLMSLAVFFSIVSAYLLAKKRLESAMKWGGLALALVGLHFLIFVIYSYLVNIMNYLILAEIWTIPLLGLGITMIITNLHNNEEQSI